MSSTLPPSARFYRLSVAALGGLSALIFAANCYGNELLVRYRAHEQLSIGLQPEPGDPGFMGWGPGVPYRILFWLVFTIVAIVEAITLRGYRWYTAKTGGSEAQRVGNLEGKTKVSDAIGRGVQLFRVRVPNEHFIEIAELPALSTPPMGRRRILKVRDENVWYALLTIPYKDEEEIIVRGPSAQWEDWDWRELAAIADSCRWQGVGSAPRYVI